MSVLCLLPAVLMLLSGALPPGAEAASTQQNPPTVLAYYYIWYTPSSWSRAKTDYPLLGRYSSDEQQVMRQHVSWAKETGIDGFIVSWKGTAVLNRRLEKLIEVANEEHFKLAIIYQGLDFEREPLPVGRIAADLDLFLERYAANEAFSLFARYGHEQTGEHANQPVIIWSGTWRFSVEEVAEVVSKRRDSALILASERNLEGYRRLADEVDGNAYYWSSVDPATFPDYEGKLLEMGDEVHAHDGLWIAPAAPGFDARLVGGTEVVKRKDGETLRQEMDAAVASSPDVVGLISWNEFSENTHIEPSENYGMRYVEVLADILNSPAPAALDFDSSEPAGTRFGYGPPVLGALMAVILASAVVVRWRRLRGNHERPE